MNRRLHLALALLVGWLWPDDDYTAIGLGILWGVTVGMSVNAYWLEVIDQ